MAFQVLLSSSGPGLIDNATTGGSSTLREGSLARSPRTLGADDGLRLRKMDMASIHCRLQTPLPAPGRSAMELDKSIEAVRPERKE